MRKSNKSYGHMVYNFSYQYGSIPDGKDYEKYFSGRKEAFLVLKGKLQTRVICNN